MQHILFSLILILPTVLFALPNASSLEDACFTSNLETGCVSRFLHRKSHGCKHSCPTGPTGPIGPVGITPLVAPTYGYFYFTTTGHVVGSKEAVPFSASGPHTSDVLLVCDASSNCSYIQVLTAGDYHVTYGISTPTLANTGVGIFLNHNGPIAGTAYSLLNGSGSIQTFNASFTILETDLNGGSGARVELKNIAFAPFILSDAPIGEIVAYLNLFKLGVTKGH